MGLKTLVKDIVKRLGYDIIKRSNNIYNEDFLITWHNHHFMDNPYFSKAYERGIKACEGDCKMHWRVHIALWIASQAKKLSGDFVECGVNRGFLSSAIMTYISWNSLNKNFFLFDTFCGLDQRYTTENEKKRAWLESYSECYEKTKANFSEFKNVHLIRGTIPDILSDHSVSTQIKNVCYLSLDMNCAKPEIAAADFFWDKLVSGAFVLLDDYTYCGYEEQYRAFNSFAQRRNIEILSLPTGQGLFIKP